MKYDTLPPEFEAVASLVSYVCKRTANEWSGSCPTCGGIPHRNGEPPDRFRMWRVSRYGKPLGWCRSCGYVWTSDTGRKPTKDEIEFWQKEQIQIEQERRDQAERALELLQNERMWEKFYSQNNRYSMDYFAERGLSKSWIEYLKLGLVPDYIVKSRQNGEWEYYHSPAVSHPVWMVGGIVQNIKLRVTSPRRGADRYRNWYKTEKSYLHVPLYDLPLSGVGVIVEGEFKADVLEQTLDDLKFRVVGLQSKTPASAIFAELKDLDPIYVWLDEDAFCKENGKESAVEYVVRMVGKERARIVQCPVKVDDGIVKYGLEPMKYIKMARKAL